MGGYDYGKPARLTASQKHQCAEVALTLNVSVASVERCMRYHSTYIAPTERNQAICQALGVQPPWGDGLHAKVTVAYEIGDQEFTRRTALVPRHILSIAIITGHAVPTKNGKWKLR